MRHLVRPAAIVAAYFDTLTPPQQVSVRAMQQALLEAVPTLEQSVKWGNLTFTCHGRNALAIVVHKAHLTLQVFNGVLLGERFPQLEGVGKGMRHMKLRYGQAVDVELVGQIARAAVATASDESLR
ncbi:MAG: DUF1801 domain-containing protein [Leptothrix sp. (in: b-proteobacteria)]